MRAALVLALCSLGTAAWCPGPTPPPAPLRQRGGGQVTATWYQVDGSKVAWTYHGNPAARMAPGCLTAAHLSLPFGTRLRVTRAGRSVEVTVTDRGPEAWTGSGLDLSLAAAEALGMRALGRATVEVEVLP